MRLLFIMLVLGLGWASMLGCSTPPTVDEFEQADFGEFPERYESLVRTYLDENYFAPDDVRELAVLKPVRGFYDLGLGSFEPGWRSSVSFRLALASGELGVERRFIAIIRNDAVQIFRPGGD